MIFTMETSEQISRRLFSRTTHGIKLGLERMRSASESIGDPHKEYKSFHVAGTNGKGSVCAYLESCLRGLGFKTGLFTSPHILTFEERFILNGKPVAGNAWVDVYKDLEKVIEERELTFFEAATIIAMELFRREKVDWAVFETGLGGRLDATNILRPRVAVITKLAMDHMQYLGNDLESVAREKLGIVKRGVPLVMAEPQEPSVRKLALGWCLQNASRCQFVSASSAQEIGCDAGQPWFTYHDRKIELPLAGGYQILNAIVAIKALATAGFKDIETIALGICSTRLPGRFQTAEVRGKTVVFDVGHNPDAAQSFIETLAAVFPEKSVCIITGIMKDKDATGIFEQYCKKASRIVLTRPNIDRSSETGELRGKIPEWFMGEVVEVQKVGEAVEMAVSSSYDVICIVGSFYTVGEGMQKLGVTSYPELK
jgi:dihydrofolate synthase / folylpolyglutamate synthase